MRGAIKGERRDPSSAASKNNAKTFPVVGIGASAGGLEAFSDLLHHLPEKTGMAFVLVQHLDPKHGSELREILARTTRIPVQQVTDGAKVKPDNIYVIPPNTSMVLNDGVLRLAARVLTHGQHMPIDHFLRSLAEAGGTRAISVILSGTASDGTEGSRAIKAAGGITFAQDEETAKYPSMPRSAFNAGCIDFVLPPEHIAKELTRVALHPHTAPITKEKPDLPPGEQMEALTSLLRDATGVDFTHYKQTTLQRRIRRRMVLHKSTSLKDYVRFVRNTPGEIDELYRDILIHVTGFFRDPAAFESLRKYVLPYLFNARQKSTIRVWVPGCSTGEEVYSLAMVMLEYLWLETNKTAKVPLGSVPFQIFATDISENALDRARAGLYSESMVESISADRLRRFFIRLDGGYQIVKPVREMCIFARQNVAKDPPFSNLDLISCRNLLIYMGPVLQKRVVPTLHYALKPDGYLMLGEAENLGAFGEYFTPVEKKSKIFQKKKTAIRLVSYFGALDYGVRRATEDPKIQRELRQVFTVEKEVDRLLMSRFVPASVVVNEEMEIVHLRGKTGPYLEPAAGQPTFSLSKMAREGLLVDLRAALARAKKENTTVRKEGVCVQSNGNTREVNLEVTPMRGSAPGERYFVIVFQDVISPEAKRREEKKKAGKARDGASRDNAQLKRELTQLREQFQSLLEEHETTTEEFRSANEEVLSGNEELQSTNEELETAKEELQSTNEELTTLNEELQNRNAELTSANNDLLNLLGNVIVPVVIVDQELRIRRFTPPAQKLLNLLPSDVGRRLSEIRPNLNDDHISTLARETIESVIPQDKELQEIETGAWYQMRMRPYKTWDNKIDGAVISFENIDGLKRNVELLNQYAAALIENARNCILILDGNLRVVGTNASFRKKFGVTAEETDNRPVYDLGNGQWNIPRLRDLLENVLPSNGMVEDFEVRHDFPHLGTRTMIVNARRVEPQPGRQLILLYIDDVTDRAA